MLKIKTLTLQEMVAKASKGVGNNRLVPMTTLMCLQVKDGEFTILTTDDVNYLYVREPMDAEDFYTVVPAEQFIKLVAKLTSEETVLNVKDNCLEVIANGTYKIAIQSDVDGSVVRFTDPVQTQTESAEHLGVVGMTTIKAILQSLKPALAVTMERPQYTNYYVGDTVLATDTFKISSLNVSVFEKPFLIPAPLMALLDVIPADQDVAVGQVGSCLIFATPCALVYGPVDENVTSFNIDAIKQLMAMEYSSRCTLDKLTVLQALDRISLFIGVFDNGVLNIEFGADGLRISSKASNGDEVIPYVNAENIQPMTSIISLDRLKAQIKAQSGDTVEMFFEDGKPLKMVDESLGLTSIVALE